MLNVIAQDFIKPEAVEIVLPLYRELVEKTRQEDLCITYDLFIDQKDPRTFRLHRGMAGSGSAGRPLQDRAFHAAGSTYQRPSAAGCDPHPDGWVPGLIYGCRCLAERRVADSRVGAFTGSRIYDAI